MTRSHQVNSKKQYYWEQLTFCKNISEIPRSSERTRTAGAQKQNSPIHLVDTRIRRNNKINSNNNNNNNNNNDDDDDDNNNNNINNVTTDLLRSVLYFR